MTKNKILPVFIPHGGCRHRCIFCDQYRITAEDHLPSEEELEVMIPPDLDNDTELAFYGGTFTALPAPVRRAYLEFARRKKEEGVIKGIRLSTHPAYMDAAIAGELESYGVDVVELGIQSTDDNVLNLSSRGHGSKEVFAAAETLSASEMRWGIQLMVGLPGDSEEKDLRSVVQLLPYRPDMARIYPVLVLKGTPLARMWQRGEYAPLTLDEAVRISGKMLALFSHAGVPVIRMGLQPTEEITFGSDTLLAGPFHPAFGYLVRCFLKREQMAMLLKAYDEPSLRFLGPKKDLPLLFGYQGETPGLLAVERKLAVGESDLPRGAVALAPFSKKEKRNILGILTEEDFLEKYTERDRSIYCI
ncbi:MAG: elongator complex protein 3 [Clostridia bacterium]